MVLQHANSNHGETIPGMPQLTEYLFSKTLKSVKESAVLISENSIAEARKIKEQPGKYIWLYGGATLSDTLMKVGLVDELWLSVHPILLDKGNPLFYNQNHSTKLRLLENKSCETDLVSMRYQIVLA